MNSGPPVEPGESTHRHRHERQLELIRIAPKLLIIAVGLVAAVLLAREIADFAGRTTRVGLGPLSMEAEAKLQRVNRSDRSASGRGAGERPPLSEEDQERIIRRYDELADVLPRTRILWVDDQPANNIPLVDFFDAIGAHVEVATSFDEALARLNERTFDAVISDYSRPTDRVQTAATASGEQFFGSGAILAQRVYTLTCRRKLILFSSAGPDLPVPPYVFAQTNDPAALLNYVADLIDRQGDNRCE